MTTHPSTFAAEPSGEQGFGWDDGATLHRREDGGGVFHGFKAIRHGTVAELARYFANLPAAERSHYMIEKAGDRQYQPHEIMALVQRPDFPLRFDD